MWNALLQINHLHSKWLIVGMCVCLCVSNFSFGTQAPETLATGKLATRTLALEHYLQKHLQLEHYLSEH